MSVVKPEPGRSRFQQSMYGPRLIIPAPRSLPIVLFLSLWLAGWVVGLLAAIHGLHAPNAQGGGQGFLVLWLTFWILGGGWAMLTILWMLVGKEIVTVERGLLIVRLEVLGFGRTRQYSVPEMRDLRTREPPRASGGRALQAPQPSFKTGTIAFDYGARTYGFGLGLEQGEAKEVLRQLIPDLRAAGAQGLENVPAK